MIAASARRARWLASSLIAAAAMHPLAMAQTIQPAPIFPAAAERVVAPEAERAAQESAGAQAAIFAGGRYWSATAVFSHVSGVDTVTPGYIGVQQRGALSLGPFRGPRPRAVPLPAEAVRVTYDPAKIRYDQLLRIYFTVLVDPTQRDGQGPDKGSKFRAALVPTSQEQLLVASAYLSQMRASELWALPIATRIETGRSFTPAEPAPAQTPGGNSRQPATDGVAAPKLALLRRHFPQFYKAGFTPE